MVGAGTIVAGEELALVGQTRVLVRTVSNIPRMSDTKPQKVDGNSTNQGARSNERRPRGPGEVGPTRPSCKIRERGPWGGRRNNHDDDDNDQDSLRYAQPPTHEGDGREERAPCRPIWMGGCRPSRRPLAAMPAPSANGVSIHWPRPSRPSCTIVQGSPPSRTSGTICITSQSGSGIPPTEPKHKHNHKHRSHLESPNPPKIQRLQLAKVGQKGDDSSLDGDIGPQKR